MIDVKNQNLIKKSFSGKSVSKNIGSASRDEMNLAEFPLAVLSTRVDPKIKTLEFSDYTRGSNGEMTERKWIITGADKFGLPTSTDDDVVLGLIRLTMEQGFRDPKVYFTRYELLRTLRWSTEGRSYQRLIKSLDRLSGVRIRSSNSFYDNSSKSYQTSNFGIIDAYEINDERSSTKASTKEYTAKDYADSLYRDNKNFENKNPDGKHSFFIWSDMLFDSFQSGYIKKLDLDLYFCLKSAVSRRLYRYLDKHFYFKNTIECHLLTLAFEKLGLSRSYKYVSSVKQQLEPALEELLKHGFISSFEYAGDGVSSVIRFTKGGEVVNTSSVKAVEKTQTKRTSSNIEEVDELGLDDDIEAESINTGKQNTLGLNNSAVNQNKIVLDRVSQSLTERGLSNAQVNRLLSGKTDDLLLKLELIIRFYDELVHTNDKRVSKNPIGFLYRAIESPFKIMLPAHLQTQSTNSANANLAKNNGAYSNQARFDNVNAIKAKRALKPEHKIFKSTSRTNKPVELQNTETQSNDPKQKIAYENYIRNELNCVMTRMAPAQLGELFAETENKMKSLKRILSADRFQEALEGCVRDELKRRFRLATFTEWAKSNG